MNVYHKIVQHKMKSITAAELMMYAKQYNVSLSPKDAEIVVQMMREKTIDVFNEQARKDWIRELAYQTSPQLAKQANDFIRQFIQ
ncbi:Protein of unknown function [Anoxybacillus pushchinoensis]|uniref:DUF2624 domain-containing protein n=1 Tax=Anoxybacillus pushchinoensis TaxID=150248 RepID=A0A1I0TQI5_9BACL|nr:DUF2624 domain-containing protein [Anoxybacillus pushchinoensis]SFA54019.1 Protein of unknown function [Anoxybacillus pushchinoensis]